MNDETFVVFTRIGFRTDIRRSQLVTDENDAVRVYSYGADKNHPALPEWSTRDTVEGWLLYMERELRQIGFHLKEVFHTSWLDDKEWKCT